MTDSAIYESHKRPLNMRLWHNLPGSLHLTGTREMLTKVSIALTEVIICFHLETSHQLHSRLGSSPFAPRDRCLDSAAAARSERLPQPMNREPDSLDGICDAGNAPGLLRQQERTSTTDYTDNMDKRQEV